VASAVAEAPHSGQHCDEVRPGYLKRQAGSHVLFYRLDGQTVDVVRILHQRMDFGRHL
jgi:toxin ParE1/3/4